MRFANLLAAAFVVLLPFSTAQQKDYYPDGGPSMATIEEAELVYEIFKQGVMNRTTGCLAKRARYITDAMANADTMLDLTSKLRGGNPFIPSGDGQLISLGGSSKVTAEELLQLEKRYFGKLSKEKQDTVTETLANALTKLPEIHMLCLEACPRTVAALVTEFHNETIHFCPLLFEDGHSWWDIILERDHHVRIESAHTCRSLTIIHEMMHLADRPFPGMNISVFPEHIGDQTFDWCPPAADKTNCKVYGRAASQMLARVSQRQALQNADNYAFYVADVVLAYTDGMKELERRRQREVEASWPSTIDPTIHPIELSNEVLSSDTAGPRPDETESQEDNSQTFTDDTTKHLPTDSESLTDHPQTQPGTTRLIVIPQDDEESESPADVSQAQADDRKPTRTLQNDQQNGDDAFVDESMNGSSGYLRGMLNSILGLFGKSRDGDGRESEQNSQEAENTGSGGARTTSMADYDEL